MRFMDIEKEKARVGKEKIYNKYEKNYFLNS